jgi:RNA-binding protein
MELTSKQRATLRAMANSLDPVIHVGKDGITDNIIKQTYDALKARELIKGQVLKNAPCDARQASDELCKRLGASPVQCIGQRFVIYRESDDNKKIFF